MGGMNASAPDDRRVLLASPRGYCAGVDRAVVTVEKALELFEKACREDPIDTSHLIPEYFMRGFDGEPRFEAMKKKLRIIPL